MRRAAFAVCALKDQRGHYAAWQQLELVVRAAVQPARVYFGGQLQKHAEAINIAEVAEYAVPYRAIELLVRATPADSNQALETFRLSLKRLPLVLRSEPAPTFVRASAYEDQQTAARGSILSEVPRYLSLATGIDKKHDICVFWRTHGRDLPNLFRFFHVVGTLQPTSAASERVFSRWQASFGNKSIVDAKEDYMESAVMLQVNGNEI